MVFGLETILYVFHELLCGTHAVVAGALGGRLPIWQHSAHET